MTSTHGGDARKREFRWCIDPLSKTVHIVNENGRKHEYSLQEIVFILNRIRKEFGNNFFPLANNVEKLSNGTEQLGLGLIILQLGKSDVAHAQGASYLGVVLEQIGYLQWNGQNRGIMWRLIDSNFEEAEIESRLRKFSTDA
jgi:hypothetical protein